MNTGRKCDVLIREIKRVDPSTGVEYILDYAFTVWADEGQDDLMKSVEGVTFVYSGQPLKTEYMVYVDPRYDIEFVKREVEAVILCQDKYHDPTTI